MTFLSIAWSTNHNQSLCNEAQLKSLLPSLLCCYLTLSNMFRLIYFILCLSTIPVWLAYVCSAVSSRIKLNSQFHSSVLCFLLFYGVIHLIELSVLILSLLDCYSYLCSIYSCSLFIPVQSAYVCFTFS